MKKSLIFKPDIKLKKEYNPNKELSLHILSMKKTDLGQFLAETCRQNPFLTMQARDEKLIEYQSEKESLASVFYHQLFYLEKTIPEDLFYYLTSCLDSNGYFKYSLEEVIQHSFFSKNEVEDAIDQLQRLDPVGCYCFSLKESLKIQCEMSDRAESETAAILCDCLEALSQKDYSKIQKQYDLEWDEIEEGFQFIKTLNPKPGAQYALISNYLEPEAKVGIVDNKIEIELLNEDVKLEINDVEENNLTKELKDLRIQAMNIMNFVQKRNMTLVQILQFVCERQKDYFLKHQPLHRCTMLEAAKVCGMHVSTISRAIQGKSIEFNHTYVPIRSLFVRAGNEGYDSSFILKCMKQWIEEEDQNHPLSDDKISKLFEKQGIWISRRTISKYREAENILNTFDRKKRYQNES